MFEPAVSPRKFGIKLFSVNKDQSPEKVTSNIPTVLMSKNQNPMGMPIKRPYKPDQQVAKSVVDADEQNESVEENQS